MEVKLCLLSQKKAKESNCASFNVEKENDLQEY